MWLLRDYIVILSRITVYIYYYIEHGVDEYTKKIIHGSNELMCLATSAKTIFDLIITKAIKFKIIMCTRYTLCNLYMIKCVYHLRIFIIILMYEFIHYNVDEARNELIF